MKDMSATYKPLRRGDMGLMVRGQRPEPGDEVTAVTRAGDERAETVGRVLWSGTDDDGSPIHICTMERETRGARAPKAPQKRRPAARPKGAAPAAERDHDAYELPAAQIIAAAARRPTTVLAYAGQHPTCGGIAGAAFPAARCNDAPAMAGRGADSCDEERDAIAAEPPAPKRAADLRWWAA